MKRVKYLAKVSLDLEVEISGDDQSNAVTEFVEGFGIQFNEPGETTVKVIDTDFEMHEEMFGSDDE